MVYVSEINIPVLVLNAFDDLVSLKRNIEKDIFLQHKDKLLIFTKLGGHISFYEGIFGQSSYMMRISLDFLDSSRKI